MLSERAPTPPRSSAGAEKASYGGDVIRRGSSVTYLTSRGGRIVVPKYAAVGVAKALAESLMRYLAVELAPSGVRINAVAPAIVETDAVRTLFGAEAAGLVRAAASHNPSAAASRTRTTRTSSAGLPRPRRSSSKGR
jgi:NAD(P)-dependent dehydrogenase (short-subunit alcohol dehydrogenase family)